ncbi:MAG TPA: hypothetical protein VEC12_02965 [Bacteroidia bacterium]|nr:hypothetical protein [Bacteroidia bacterium]
MSAQKVETFKNINAANAEQAVSTIWNETEKTTDANNNTEIIKLPGWVCENWKIVRAGLVIALAFVPEKWKKIIQVIIDFGDNNCGK